jgi:hypothetical protein
MYQKYSLEVVSHHKDFNNKTMLQYYVDGINTVGVYGNEPFEVRFKNNTNSKVQIKLSIDGTDVLTADKADTSVSKDMWVVQAYGTLNLKAWPETHNGGAAFVFTNASNSVAVHTHGDLSSRGIIAAAVFEEGYVPPPARFVEHHHHWNKWYTSSYPYTLVYPLTFDYNGFASGTLGSGSITCNTNNTFGGSGTLSANGATMDSLQADSSVYTSYNDTQESVPESKSLQSLVAVGAGQYIDQKISYVAGLTKPTFSETVRVRYLWWDDLVAKLKTLSPASSQGSGFPGDKPKLVNLGSTPRIGSYPGPAFPKQAAQVYARF